jgi:hypothetical protein
MRKGRVIDSDENGLMLNDIDFASPHTTIKLSPAIFVHSRITLETTLQLYRHRISSIDIVPDEVANLCTTTKRHFSAVNNPIFNECVNKRPEIHRHHPFHHH